MEPLTNYYKRKKNFFCKLVALLSNTKGLLTNGLSFLKSESIKTTLQVEKFELTRGTSSFCILFPNRMWLSSVHLLLLLIIVSVLLKQAVLWPLTNFLILFS